MPSPEPAGRPSLLRSCRMFGQLLLCTFAWAALLTFDPIDWPNPAVWPTTVPVHNACGRAGAYFAYHMLYYAGPGAFALIGFATALALARLARRPVKDMPLRLTGLLLIITSMAAGGAMLANHFEIGLIEGPGGIIGIAAANALTDCFSRVWSILLILLALVVGVALTADDVILCIPTSIRWVREQLTSVVHATGVQGVARRLTPVAIGAGNHGGGAESNGKRGGRAGGSAVAEPETEEESVESDGEDAAAEATVASPANPPVTAPETPERTLQPPERALIVRMLGKDRAQGKVPPSAWPKELGDYILPPLTLLGESESRYVESQEGVVREKAAILERTLLDFRIDAQVVEIDTGPVITLFEIALAPGIKVSQIASLANDIARALKAPAVRVVATLPGKNTIGIEVPNADKEKVRLKELMTLSGVKPTKMALPMFLGKDASGNPLISDLASMPHMLIAGTTGSGKSVCLNALVMSILMTQRPDHVKVILIDPKMVELSVFKEIPHLMCPIVTDMQRAEKILEWATTKMDERYELLAEAAVRDIRGFNALGKEEIYRRFQPTTEQEKLQIPTHLPYIVIFIDELADLMMTSGKEVEHHLSRLAQKSRAVGVHLVVATQRPQANVVTGLIKSNLPCRAAFRVASRMDSRIVLDQNGAEVLMGQGDMLFLPPGSSKLMRAQGTYIEDDELKAVLADLAPKAQPQFHHELVRLKPGEGEEEGERDPLFDEAVTIIVQSRRGSVSLLQRRLEVGYSRASRLIDQMAAAGIVGEYKGSQAREVLLTEKEWDDIRKQRDREVAEGNYRADMPSEEDDKYGTADLQDDDFEPASAGGDDSDD